MDTTAQSMIEFFDKAAETGRIKPNTARSMSAPVKQIFSSTGENWEQIDVSELDVDDFLARFRNLHGLNYKQRSLAEYERRFRRAVDLYLEYMRNPKTWKFNSQDSAASKAKPKKVGSKKTVQSHASEPVETTTVSIAPSGIQMMDYPFPLREACVVRLRLPADLKVSEVERLAAFMRTLTADFASTGT